MRQAVARLASLENWNNAPSPATPEGVAGVFAASVLKRQHPSLAPLAEETLLLFRAGRARDAKAAADGIPRSEFRSGQEYLAWAQFKALLLKSPLKGTEKQCETAAVKKFAAAESACKRANRRLRYYWSRPARENPLYRVILSRARSLISKTLGTFTDVTLEHLIDLSRPGGGSAVGTTDPLRVALPWKLSEKTQLCVTRTALPYARMLVEGSPHWLRLHGEFDAERPGRIKVPYVVTDANRVSFVPKDACTHRTIAVEPHLNLCLQLGVDAYIKRRLLSVGVNLRDQSGNQQAAYRGSLEWETADPLVTLDLSSASDTLCIGLVERLLPPLWHAYLHDIRSSAYTLRGGEPTEYQKWSSMGNGYTFALESLIFWALGKACSSLVKSKDYIRVYGDDIIVRRSVAALLTEVLRYCGFSVNLEKTAIFGPFRESCGEDFWAGLRVVPIYLRERSNLLPTDMYRLVNTLPREHCTDDMCRYFLESHRGRPVLYGLPTHDPSHCWFTSLDHARKTRMVKWRRDLQCWEQRVARFEPFKAQANQLACYAAALLGHRQDDPEWLVAKAALRRRGKWSLSRVSTG